MARRLQKTLVDYLVIAISPALIMTLVGSLVFFLLEVFYQGNFHGRLQYIFALFVVGTVSIGRISIEEGRERAMVFALPLGIVTLLAINKFVEFQGDMLASLSFFINCGLIGLIWWSADRLTWDCTLIDESKEDSGEGLLEAVGLDHASKTALQEELAPLPPEPEATTSREEPQGWWERFIKHRRRPHAPGIWVVYFSLAAVALFGIGQLFVPTNDLPARQYAFQLLCIYTASGLGLLLTTSFLGLRRYLRQRRQEMPLSMVSLWLVLGAVLIVGVMLTTMFLPRPNPEYAVSELPFRVGSPDQKSSRYGTGKEAVREQQPWSQGVRHDAQQSADVRSDRSSNVPSKDRPEQRGNDQTSVKQDGENSREQHGTRNQSEQQSSARDKSEQATSPQSSHDSKQNTADSADATTRRASNDDRGQQRDNGGDADNIPLATHSPSWLHDISRVLSAAFFKWLFYGVLVMIAAFSIWVHRYQLVAALNNFCQRLLDFWQSLFGGTDDPTDATPDKGGSARPPLRRFTDFTNPFAAGIAATWPPKKLVRYTFEAMEAWAAEHGCPRQAEQTPHEFARCLASNVSSLADDARRLADLYCQVAYASDTLPIANMARLSRLWQNLTMPNTH